MGIDAHNIRGNGGSVIHLKEILNNSLPERDNFDKLIVWVNADTFKKLPQKEFIDYVVLPNRNSIRSFIWQKFKLEKEAKLKNCNVLFFPGGIYLGKFKPFVAFAQSMLPFDHQARKIYNLTLQYWILFLKEILMLNSFNKANAVIFVSNTIKKQVEKINNKTFTNSKVIHHGVGEIFKQKENRKRIQDKPIKLLTVSSHALHKNLINLVKVIASIKNDGYDVELKIVGPKTKYGTGELLKEVKNIDKNNLFIKILSEENYEDLPGYYNEADIFIAPSLCESFGLPIKEAIVNKIPIIYNSIEAFKEILNDNNTKIECLEFDGTKGDLKIKILKLINNYEKIGKEVENLNNDGWTNCARETFTYINKISQNI